MIGSSLLLTAVQGAGCDQGVADVMRTGGAFSLGRSRWVVVVVVAVLLRAYGTREKGKGRWSNG